MRDRVEGNPRMTQALRVLDRLRDLDAVVAQERARATRRPDRAGSGDPPGTPAKAS